MAPPDRSVTASQAFAIGAGMPRMDGTFTYRLGKLEKLKANKPVESQSSESHLGDDAPIELENFIPYRLTVLGHRVGKAVAERYSDRFKLLVPEWRVMSVLARFPDLALTDLVDLTALDLVAVSRAVAGLEAAGRVRKLVDRKDRRKKCLRLSRTGMATYRKIVPYAREIERSLLDQFNPEERRELLTFLNRITTSLDRLAK